MRNLILSALVLASAFQTALGEQSGDWTYSVENNQATITAYTGAGGAVTIPSELNGIPVVQVGSGEVPIQGWEYGSSITSISISQGISRIGRYAFYGSSITSVDIPNSVTDLGEYAFYSCTNFTALRIPNSVVRIGDGALCGLEELTSFTLDLPNSNFLYQNGVLFNQNQTFLIVAFPKCLSGVTYTIPNTVTSIGILAFLGCDNLTDIAISSGVTNIGNGAFAECAGLTNMIIPNSVITIGMHAFNGCILLENITISNSVTSIGDNAFGRCFSLTSVIIPNSVTSIGDYAFDYCTGLTTITIPNSVTSIGNDAFRNCTSLVNVFLPARLANTYQDFGLTSAQVVFYDLGDDDGDGQTNLDEIIAGTDPLNPNSRFAIDTIVASPGGIILTWTAVSGRKYTVEARQDFSSGTWASVATGLTTGSYTDSSSLPPKKFYRLVVQ
jgi:hypothetical protein